MDETRHEQEARGHKSVLLRESIELLAIQKGEVVVDATFGGGGHSREIVERFGTSVRLVCVDLDENARRRFQEASFPDTAIFVQENFKEAAAVLAKSGNEGVDRIIFDLGVSSFQLDEDDRGFSFRSDTPLAMTFSKKGSHTGVSAEEVVNGWSEETLAAIIEGFGENRAARKIARAIVAAREEQSIKTSGALTEIVLRATPRRGRIHPATTVFQAIRIAVNDELNVLSEALGRWWQALRPRGRMAVISFHSLEDRIVKKTFIQFQQALSGRIITKKPTVAGAEERKENPRSRSAKLRVIEKL